MPLNDYLRSSIAAILSTLPPFRGKGRITLFLDRVLTNNNDPSSYIVAGILNGDTRFLFDLRAWGQKFAFYYRSWENTYVDILRQLYSGGIFLDVGSSLGLYVACMGEKVRSLGGSIVSIEPVPFNLQRQREIIKLNGLEDNVQIFAIALGAEKSVVKISTDPTGADNNAIISGDGNLEVPVEPLDAMVAEHRLGRIGLIKMDVEGYEPKVIEGAVVTIARDRPIIFAEFNKERMVINNFTIDSAWNLLVGSLNYSCRRLDEKTGRLCLVEDPDNLEDLFFIPSELNLPPELIL